MSFDDRRFVEWARRESFAASAAPYLILDRELRIRAVNEAYQRVTLQPAEALLGTAIFEAFPDNPNAPEAQSVANLSRSLEKVLQLGKRHWMAIQRYDVPAPGRDGSFVRKVWRPINSPLRDGITVVGVLHHVEDVTAAFDKTCTEAVAGSDGDGPVANIAAALAHERQVTAALRTKAENLNTALQSSREIGMAVGIVMSSCKVTETAAFDMMRSVSQETHRKIRDIAADIVEQGHLDLTPRR